MMSDVVRIAWLTGALALYVGAFIVFALLASSGPSFGLLDTVSAMASAYAAARLARALREHAVEPAGFAGEGVAA